MKIITPACIGAANLVASRLRRPGATCDRGAFFLRYGVPLLLVTLLLVQFTDIEHDFVTQVEALVQSLRATLSSGEADF